jgi:hypothetical protein
MEGDTAPACRARPRRRHPHEGPACSSAFALEAGSLWRLWLADVSPPRRRTGARTAAAPASTSAAPTASPTAPATRSRSTPRRSTAGCSRALPRLLPRFDERIERIEDRHAAERRRLEQLAGRERDGLEAQRRRTDAVEAKWAEYVATRRSDVVWPILEKQRRALADAEVRVAASQDALAPGPVAVPHDRLLDFAANLRAVIAGRLKGDRSVEQVNRSLSELFARSRSLASCPPTRCRKSATPRSRRARSTCSRTCAARS